MMAKEEISEQAIYLLKDQKSYSQGAKKICIPEKSHQLNP